MEIEERVSVRICRKGGSVVVRIPAARTSQAVRQALSAVRWVVPCLPAEEKGIRLYTQEEFEVWMEEISALPPPERRILRPILAITSQVWLSPSGRELRLSAPMADWSGLQERGELLRLADGRLFLRRSGLV